MVTHTFSFTGLEKKFGTVYLTVKKTFNEFISLINRIILKPIVVRKFQLRKGIKISLAVFDHFYNLASFTEPEKEQLQTIIFQ